MNARQFAALALAGLLAYLYVRKRNAPLVGTSPDRAIPANPSSQSMPAALPNGGLLSVVYDAWRDFVPWTPPAEAAKYLPLIRKVEAAYKMPENLLARLLYQESRFRPDIISGKTTSRVGAQGIAQVMPATAKAPGYGVPALSNPLNPNEAIPWAGAYLNAMKNQTGSWGLALAAYNGGLGVARKAATAWPRETANYVIDILKDVKAEVYT